MPSAPCDVCGDSFVAAVVARGERTGAFGTWRYALLKCAGCGHGRLVPPPPTGALDELYKDYYGEGANNADAAAVDRTTSQLMKTALARLGGASRRSSLVGRLGGRVTRVLEGVSARSVPLTSAVPMSLDRHARILDYGCGAGVWLLSMRRSGFQHLTGLELDYDHLKNLEAAGIEIVHGLDAVPDASLDCVRIHHVLEHVPDPLATLRGIHRVLKPEGALLIGVPNFDAESAKLLGENWSALVLPFHLNHFTTASLRRLLDRAGFTLREVQYRPIWEHAAPALMERSASRLRSRIWGLAYYHWAREAGRGDFLDCWAVRG